VHFAAYCLHASLSTIPPLPPSLYRHTPSAAGQADASNTYTSINWPDGAPVAESDVDAVYRQIPTLPPEEGQPGIELEAGEDTYEVPWDAGAGALSAVRPAAGADRWNGAIYATGDITASAADVGTSTAVAWDASMYKVTDAPRRPASIKASHEGSIVTDPAWLDAAAAARRNAYHGVRRRAVVILAAILLCAAVAGGVAAALSIGGGSNGSVSTNAGAGDNVGNATDATPAACVALVAPSHGNITGGCNGTDIGDRCQYACDSG